MVGDPPPAYVWRSSCRHAICLGCVGASGAVWELRRASCSHCRDCILFWYLDKGDGVGGTFGKEPCWPRTLILRSLADPTPLRSLLRPDLLSGFTAQFDHETVLMPEAPVSLYLHHSLSPLQSEGWIALCNPLPLLQTSGKGTTSYGNNTRFGQGFCFFCNLMIHPCPCGKDFLSPDTHSPCCAYLGKKCVQIH